MSLKQVMIDGQLADQAEEMAEILGYTGSNKGASALEYYIMDLIEEDISRKQQTAAVVRGVIKKEIKEADIRSDKQ